LLDDVWQCVDDAAQQVRQHVRQAADERCRRLNHGGQNGADDARKLWRKRRDKRLHRLHEARRHRLQARDDVVHRGHYAVGQIADKLVNVLIAVR